MRGELLQAVKAACSSAVRELFDNDNSALAPGCAGGSRRREPLSESWAAHAKRGGHGDTHPTTQTKEEESSHESEGTKLPFSRNATRRAGPGRRRGGSSPRAFARRRADACRRRRQPGAREDYKKKDSGNSLDQEPLVHQRPLRKIGLPQDLPHNSHEVMHEERA